MAILIISGFVCCIVGIGSVVFGVLADISDNKLCAISSLAGTITVSGIMLILGGFGVIQ